MGPEPLACPVCHARHPADERFCRDCGMPLVHADRPVEAPPVNARHERARKIKPQYTDGELVKVAWARHQAEAELIQGLLLEEGVPSIVRRARGFDVPDMLAAGPRDVLVPASGAEAAREILLQAELLRPEPAAAAPRPTRVLGALLLGLLVIALLAVLVAL